MLDPFSFYKKVEKSAPRSEAAQRERIERKGCKELEVKELIVEYILSGSFYSYLAFFFAKNHPSLLFKPLTFHTFPIFL